MLPTVSDVNTEGTHIYHTSHIEIGEICLCVVFCQYGDIMHQTERQTAP